MTQRGKARLELGRWGEAVAADWYEAHGYRIIDRNWRVAGGEIDLIAEAGRGDVVVFCEVKTRRSSRFGSGADAVTPAKQRKVRSLAAQWLRSTDCRYGETRFDVADVTADGTIDVIVGCF